MRRDRTRTGGAGRGDGFARAPIIPAVLSVFPALGSIAGGTSIAISGAGFTGATGVTINGVSCTSVVVASDNVITAVTGSSSSATSAITVAGLKGSIVGSSFTYLLIPSDLAGVATMTGWWKADSGTSTVVDGSQINTWLDSSGHNKTATSSTTKPTYAANSTNGYPGVNVDHGDGVGFTSFATSGVNCTMYVACRPRLKLNGNSQWLCSDVPGAWGMFISTSGHIQAYNGAFPDSGVQAADNTPFYFGVKQTSAVQVELRVNGGSVIVAAAANSPLAMCIAAAGGQTGGMTGVILEAVLFSAVISGPDTTAIELYFHTKYGI